MNKKFEVDILSASNFTSFGFCMSGRKHSTPRYRYSFNTQEKIEELGEGHTTALYWEYDGRTGRRWNLDPKPTVAISNYACFANNPIWFTDVAGDTVTINLFTKDDGDNFYMAAQNAVHKQVNDGVFLVFGHSNPDGLQYTDKDGVDKSAKTAEAVNIILSERSAEYKQSLKEGKQIILKLNSCNTASFEYIEHDKNKTVIKRKNPIALKISGGLPKNSIVIAADGYVMYYKSKVVGVVQTNGKEKENTKNGGFVVIQNGKIKAKFKMAWVGGRTV